MKKIAVTFALLAFSGVAQARTLTGLWTAPYQRTTLVRPSGALVGGQWKRWILEAQVPTPPLRVELMPPSACNAPGLPPVGGCSDMGPPWQLAAEDRTSLYFELGHIFDANSVTIRDEQRFRNLWHVPQRTPWQDSDKSLSEGLEDGLAVDFAAAYQQCASGLETPIQYLGVGPAPTIYLTSRTCDLIRTIGEQSDYGFSGIE